MGKVMDEYESMKYFLGKVKITDSKKHGKINEDIPGNGGQTTSKQGEKIQFNNIKTVGFLKNLTGAGLEQDTKNNIISAVEDFIKGSGLIASILEIRVLNGRIILFTNTIQNPGIDFIKSITIDTDLDDPKLDFLSANVNINADYMTLIGNLTKTYQDNQVGRQKLVQASQINSTL